MLICQFGWVRPGLILSVIRIFIFPHYLNLIWTKFEHRNFISSGLKMSLEHSEDGSHLLRIHNRSGTPQGWTQLIHSGQIWLWMFSFNHCSNSLLQAVNRSYSKFRCIVPKIQASLHRLLDGHYRKYSKSRLQACSQLNSVTSAWLTGNDIKYSHRWKAEHSI